jgi:uncharacterized membrane protein YfcA
LLHFLWLVPLGFFVGAFGTLIGAGGGFLLVPILLLLYPHEQPDTITSISLAVVFFNAASGSLAYSRMRRIDYRSGFTFAVATIPGAILGALTTSWIPRRAFDLIFGMLMITGAAFLVRRAAQKPKESPRGSFGRVMRTLTEADGTVHTYSYNSLTGILLSLAVGYISSLLGIGGGIIHVPVLVQVLSFPVHIATATSHFVLSIMALAGTAVHVHSGALDHVVGQAASLSVGVLIGAQLGARLSTRVHGPWIIRSLGIALGFVGIRILILAL